MWYSAGEKADLPGVAFVGAEKFLEIYITLHVHHVVSSIQITCIDGRSPMNLNVTHNSCDNLNFSTQITFPGCTAISVMSHRDVQTTGRTFRIEYTVTGYGNTIPSETLII